MSKEVSVNAGIGLGGAAFLVLFVMKIGGWTDMHWFWVLTSALWLPIAMVLGIMLMVAGCLAAFAAIGWLLIWVADQYDKVKRRRG